MTEEELRACIDALRAENEMLRAQLEMPKESRAMCPEKAAEIFGDNVNRLNRGSQIHSLSFMYHTEIEELSKLIRGTCFPCNERRQKTRNGSEPYIHRKLTLKDMTDEQYDKYSEIFLEMLAVLQKYALPVLERVGNKEEV